MKKEKSIVKDAIIAGIYISIFILIFFIANKKLVDPAAINSFQIWLTSGILYLILSKYLLERFFTTPTNIFANSLGILIALVFDTNKNTMWYIVFIFIILVLLWSLVVILTVKKEYKLKNTLYKGILKLGNPKLLFSIIFLSYSFIYLGLKNLSGIFILSIILFIDIISINFIENSVYWIFKLFKNKHRRNINILGIPRNLEKSDFFILDLDLKKTELVKDSLFALKRKDDIFNIILLVSKTHTHNFIRYIFSKTKIKVSSSDLGINFLNNSILLSEGAIVYFNKTDNIELQSKIEEEKSEISSCVGYIEENSDISTVKFLLFNDFHKDIFEGSIIYSYINNVKTLYQVLNAFGKNEETGQLRVIAQKLGNYDESNRRINHIKWLPKLFEKVYIDKVDITEDIDEKTIGVLPNTSYEIRLSNINHLVTYNSAILGILGIGKSCLSFELIQKIAEENIKVICIDVTEQYATYDGLYKYIDKQKIEVNDDLVEAAISTHQTRTGRDNSPMEWGNMGYFKDVISQSINSFLDSESHVLKIINPNYINVYKAATQFRIVENMECSIVEKSKIIVESIFNSMKNKGLTNEAKCLIVFEEAHSIIPEWNSVSSEGDSRHSNAIAKVILQGRKYGLGSLLITQRTANISKSALSQCNTIFAMRSFDDTSKDFLANYLGRNYVESLPSLEERHAIIIGKGIDTKIPLTVKLNDKSLFEKFNIDDND